MASRGVRAERLFVAEVGKSQLVLGQLLKQLQLRLEQWPPQCLL
jgi:hypothetical protein